MRRFYHSTPAKSLSSLLLVLALTAAAPPAAARKERLHLKESTVTTEERQIESQRKRRELVPMDSVDFAESAPKFSFAGFDKNASSLKETFYVSNDSQLSIRALDITIIYRDMSGRMLHKRSENIKLSLPAGETRMVTISAFDRQQNLYYHKSRPPRKGGMPFRVEIFLEALYR